MYLAIARNQRRSSEMLKKRTKILKLGWQMTTMTIWEERHSYFSCNLKVFVVKPMNEKSILVTTLAVLLVLSVYLQLYCFQDIFIVDWYLMQRTIVWWCLLKKHLFCSLRNIIPRISCILFSTYRVEQILRVIRINWFLLYFKRNQVVTPVKSYTR